MSDHTIPRFHLTDSCHNILITGGRCSWKTSIASLLAESISSQGYIFSPDIYREPKRFFPTQNIFRPKIDDITSSCEYIIFRPKIDDIRSSCEYIVCSNTCTNDDLEKIIYSRNALRKRMKPMKPKKAFVIIDVIELRQCREGLRKLVSNRRHNGLSTIITCSDIHEIRPEIRLNMGLIFITGKLNERHLREIYNCYIHNYISRYEFYQIVEAVNNGDRFLVIDMTSRKIKFRYYDENFRKKQIREKFRQIVKKYVAYCEFIKMNYVPKDVTRLIIGMI